MTADSRRRGKAVIESVSSTGIKPGAGPALLRRLVNDVDAVPPSMARLICCSGQPEADPAAQTTEVIHRWLEAREAHADSHLHLLALDTPMSTSVSATKLRRRGERGQDSILGDLLLQELLLLLLKLLDLILDGNLEEYKRSGQEQSIRQATGLTCSTIKGDTPTISLAVRLCGLPARAASACCCCPCIY